MILYPQVFVVTLKEEIPCSPLQIVAFNMISCMVATVNGDWVHTTISFEFLYETTLCSQNFGFLLSCLP